MSDVVKVITSPSVYLVGRQSIAYGGLDAFLRDRGAGGWDTDTGIAGQVLPEVAGRLCYDSFRSPRPGGNAAYLDHILESGHGSVCEHAVFSLIVTGVSRDLTHELVRHRVGLSYSQRSTRYCDESDCSIVAPPGILAGKAYFEGTEEIDPGDEGPPVAYRKAMMMAYGEWLESATRARRAYRNMVAYGEILLPGSMPATDRRKAARGMARSVLPGCTETEIFITGNVRAFRHFIELRGSEGADAEIRRLAGAILDVLRHEAPNLFGDYQAEDGSIRTDYRKV